MKLSTMLSLVGGLLTIGGLISGTISENKLKDENDDVDEMDEIEIDFDEIDEEV